MGKLHGPFHDGELAVQQRAGVAAEAAAVGGIVTAAISSAAARFLARQRMAVAGSLDASGRPWASLLTGPEGFLRAVDDRLLHVQATPRAADPLAANLAGRPELGLLAIDLATRRRLRVNGRGLLRDSALFLLADEVYGNCPKYIQRRQPAPPGPEAVPTQRRSAELDRDQQAAIARADTFFIASFHPSGGADVSHRGGRPGFVHVADPRRLSFPDYPGNNMFNTLGNLVRHPRVGLLFVDFESGDTVQLAGRATIRWQPERAVAVDVDEVLETRAATPLRWDLLEYSPSNP